VNGNAAQPVPLQPAAGTPAWIGDRAEPGAAAPPPPKFQPSGVRRILEPILGLAILAGLGFAAYQTRDRWLPYLFPSPVQQPEATSEDHHDEDVVELSPQARANLRLVVAPLVPQTYWRPASIPGIVVDRPGESDRGVTCRVAGVVTEIKAHPGDTVKAGDSLFTVQLASEFLQGAQADLTRAANELRIASLKRDRTAGLVKQGTAAESVLNVDENQVKRLTTQVQSLRRQLQVFGLTPAQVDRAEKGEAVTELTILAPPRPGAKDPPVTSAAGVTNGFYEVQELKVHLGEQVQAGQTLCLLADHRRLFVEGRAFKAEASDLARAAEERWPVRAEFADESASDWPPQGPLTIRHLANEVDPASRTFAFYLPLENAARTYERDSKTFFVWRYRPGQRVRLRVPLEKLGEQVFVLPAGAVVRDGPEAFIFRQDGDHFERLAVRVLYEDRTEVVIANTGSIKPGLPVVRSDAAAIYRAMKATAEHGHEHHHDHDH
jgi:multidrug efflux pump subunit AcrA (membrane-fusion protein)